jgi:hypothetical protein
MQTRSVAALASALLALAAVHASIALAQTSPAPMATTGPMTTPTKAPTDTMTPVMGPTKAPGGAMKGITPAVLGTLALDARSLRARRTRSGYTLTGQALVNDPCQAARFDPSLLTIYPPQYNLDQFRKPGSMGKLCIQRLAWVTAMPRTVSSMKPPAYVTVRTKKGTTRVSIR